MCHHWATGQEEVWEQARDELPEEDPEVEEPEPEPVTTNADDD